VFTGSRLWNILEGQFEIVLVNAQHIKAVPGEDRSERQRSGSPIFNSTAVARGFVPPRETRELRDLTRYRVS